MKYNLYKDFLLFRVVEAHRANEATATPAMLYVKEGANLSESRRAVRTIRDL